MGADAPAGAVDDDLGSTTVTAAIRGAFRPRSPIAAEAVSRDVAECPVGDTEDEDEDEVDDGKSSKAAGDKSSSGAAEPGPTLLYLRPSGVARPIGRDLLPHPEPRLSHGGEIWRSREAGRHLLSPRSIQEAVEGEINADDGAPPGEESPLIRHDTREANHHQHLDEVCHEAVAEGRLITTWSQEAKVLGRYSTPLIVAFLLQYSINVTGILAVGRIGKEELGAVSLASMTSVITCWAPFIGFATALDTLCSQAYGAGHRHLVGLQFQRMCYFLLVCFVPIAVIWWYSEPILLRLVPERRAAELAAQYLRVLIVAGPFGAVFEAGKRFVQCQGLFNAGTWVLAVAVPINIFLNWLLVWKLDWGFIGAPVAATVTEILLPIFLLLYVRFVDGYQCWGGFSSRAFVNWGPMIRLAIPDLIMVEAEYMAFELLVFASSQFGTPYLAAQSVVNTIEAVSYQVPFALSVAASTRIGNLMGAGLIDEAKISAQVAVVIGAVMGLVAGAVTASARHRLVWLFTRDAEVAGIATSVLLVVAAVQVIDPYSTNAHGILRGIGRQYVGTYTNLGGFYLVGLPISFGAAFSLGWKLHGLWFGLGVALAIVAPLEFWLLKSMDWNKAAKEAEVRNAAG